MKEPLDSALMFSYRLPGIRCNTDRCQRCNKSVIRHRVTAVSNQVFPHCHFALG